MRPPSPFVYTLTQPQCVSMSGFHLCTKSSERVAPTVPRPSRTRPSPRCCTLGVRQSSRQESWVCCFQAFYVLL